jgi:hypothetical protein
MIHINSKLLHIHHNSFPIPILSHLSSQFFNGRGPLQCLPLFLLWIVLNSHNIIDQYSASKCNLGDMKIKSKNSRFHYVHGWGKGSKANELSSKSVILKLIVSLITFFFGSPLFHTILNLQLNTNFGYQNMDLIN